MHVVGFNFTKISAEKAQEVPKSKGDRKINSNIEFTDVSTEDIAALQTNVLKISFNFSITYEPKFGSINFEGTILFKGEEDKFKEVQKAWKKKQVPEDIKLPLFNLILNKCSLKALQLEEELGLPLHINLPRVSRRD